jgi:Asp/Glu/Hydantoin racemase
MLALLHTSPVHVETFDRLRDEEAAGLVLRHAVDDALLARAREAGPTSVKSDVEDALRAARDAGAIALLCTCSTIGGVAEAARAGLPVVRVDRPMAAAAVATGSRIRILAALASTVGPTMELIAEEAAACGRAVTSSVTIVDGAWALFESGDREGYLATIADVIAATTDADVIVLAQASMADAAELASVDVPVLSSPRLGFRAAVRAAQER